MSRLIGQSIKSFECITGCSACCGVIPLEEYHLTKIGIPQKNLIYAKDKPIVNEKGEHWQLTTDGKCIMLDRETNRCTIYADRPQMCKDYGLSNQHPCVFLKPNGDKRSAAKTKVMIRERVNSVREVWKK